MEVILFLPAVLHLTTKAPNRAIPTSAAEPMAKPLPIAAVVFPAASKASVFLLTSAPRWDISAMPK